MKLIEDVITIVNGLRHTKGGDDDDEDVSKN